MSDSSSPTDVKDVESFRNDLLAYLLAERDFTQAEIDLHATLPRAEKTDLGLLVPLAVVTEVRNGRIVVSASDNNTKLRPGDPVSVIDPAGKRRKRKGVVVENRIDSLELEIGGRWSVGDIVDVAVEETVCLEPFIKQVSAIAPGLPGARFLSILGGFSKPLATGLGCISENEAASFIPPRFDAGQAAACRLAFARPSVACIQGCPGCGKTQVLAAVARGFAVSGREILVVALTHQAVNNALNKIAASDPSVRAVKIGDEFRTEGLERNVESFRSFRDYLASRSRGSRRCGDVVGMTLVSAMINIGMIASGFLPTIVLVDEAGQIPLAHAAAIGSFGCGSVVFFGDVAQMPPIYRPEQERDELSQSVMERIVALYPNLCPALSVTYRMNEEITDLVGRTFYRPRGIRLESAASVRERRSRCGGIPLLSDDRSLVLAVAERSPEATDSNAAEADAVAGIAHDILSAGIEIGDLAIVTPYRRQVKAIRERLKGIIPDGRMPLVDTVERLQGQDVEMIVLSFASEDHGWISVQREFLFDRNRLNVMVSRAKTKIVVFCGEIVGKELVSIFQL